MIKFKQKLIIIICSIIGTFLVLFVGFRFVESIFTYCQYTQINHFSDISLCSGLDDYITDEKPIVDKYIKENEYINSYNHTICYDNIEFKLYAYEFKNEDFAKEYFCRIKNDTSEGFIDYNGATNILFTSELIVRNKTNVYRIETGNSDEYLECMKLLNSIFDINIRK